MGGKAAKCLSSRHVATGATGEYDLNASHHRPSVENYIWYRPMSQFSSVYKSVEQLGLGSMGEVWRVRKEENGRIYALKCVSIENAKFRDEITNELEILSKLDHPNIIQIFECFVSPNDIRIIMEVCEGGELSCEPEEGEFEACRVMEEVMRGVAVSGRRCSWQRNNCNSCLAAVLLLSPAAAAAAATTLQLTLAPATAAVHALSGHLPPRH